MCEGEFMSKNPEEAMDFLSYVAEVSRGWDESNAREVGRMKSQPNTSNAKAGMYTLNEDTDMKAKFAAMARRLEELEVKKIREVAPQYTQPGQAPPQASNLEQAIVNLKIDSVNKRMDGIQNDLSQKIDNLQYSISRLTNLNTVQEKGKFPSQPYQNPKGIHEVEAQKGESSQMREVKAVITLRSVSSIIQCKSPVKYKDPDCPNISVMIGKTCVEKALLDLGASVNLLPYSVYKQLGLGELKPTSITLSLADRSVKIPRVMQLTFGNMTLELNIFYMCQKQFHLKEEGPEEVCMIDNLVEEHCDKKMLEDLNESLGDLDEGLPEPLDLLATLPHLKMMEEILPLFNREETQ
ncbi:hypothetical protein AAG906_041117 [Vitis piasezkii]